MAEYRVLVYDLLTNTLKDEIPFSGLHYSFALNDAGAFSGSIPTRHVKATDENISEGNTVIYVVRDGDIVWDGILWSTQTQSGPDNSTVSCNGASTWSWFQEMDGRGQYLVADKKYTNVDQLQIARELVQYALDKGAQSDIGVEVGTELTTDTGAQRLRTLVYKGNEYGNIGNLVENLSAMENGFDFRIDAEVTGTDPIKYFRLFYPTAGRDSEHIFELGVNVYSYTHVRDGGTSARRVYALGSSEGENRPVAVVADTEFTNFPMREVTFTHSSVKEMPTLTAHANADLARVRSKKEIPTVICRTDEPPVNSYVCGDRMRVKIDDGFVQVNEIMKLIQYEVRVGDDGEEEVTLRFASPEVIET